MPYANLSTPLGATFADSGGNLAVCVDGSITTSLRGRYAAIDDVCGPVNATGGSDLDLGTSGGTDCAVPAGMSSGDTHSARTVFYAVNRMREIGLGHLPGNPWLQSRVPAVTNFPSDLFLGCNAAWDGSGVLFTTSTSPSVLPPTGCSNTGELASVVAHEWSHGLDDNDADGQVSNPGEGIADVMAAFWVDDSCIGRGFFQGTNCSTPALADGLDACLDCDGVRDIDWRERANTRRTTSPSSTSCPADLSARAGPVAARSTAKATWSRRRPGTSPITTCRDRRSPMTTTRRSR